MAIGVDLGGTHLRAALITASGKIISRRSSDTSPSHSAGDILRQISGLVIDLKQQARGLGMRPAGVGLAVPGFINRERTRVLFSPNFPGWSRVPFRKDLENLSGFRCILENDANCAALGEAWLGGGKKHQNILCLTLGTGVGGGIIIEGALLRGGRGAAAEVGHTTVRPGGPRCGCGNRGCLEALVSGTAIRKRFGRSGKDLYARATKGEAGALRAFSQIGMDLGLGLANFCMILDPEVILLGGQVSRAYRFFRGTLRTEMNKRLGHHPSRAVQIRTARCGDNAGIFGAASLVFGDTIRNS